MTFFPLAFKESSQFGKLINGFDWHLGLMISLGRDYREKFLVTDKCNVFILKMKIVIGPTIVVKIKQIDTYEDFRIPPGHKENSQ